MRIPPFFSSITNIPYLVFRKPYYWIFVLAAGGGLPNPVAALDITTEDNKPFNYLNDGKVVGLSTEIVLEMGRQAKIPMKIDMYPWARAYQTAMQTPETCVYSTVRLPERENAFKWIGPIAVNKWALFGKSTFQGKIETLDDARPYRIGGAIMDAKAMYLKSLGFTNIDSTGNDNLNVAKLMSGHIDLWVAGLYKVSDLIEQGKLKNIKLVVVVREVDYYLACNPSTSETTLNALNQAFEKLQKRGYIKAVTTRYAGQMQP